MEEHKLKIIARIRTEFPDKFGIPRQSGVVKNLKGIIVFEPEFRDVSSIRGLEEFTHLWLIWNFSLNKTGENWSPTVRPPRLGGNKRVGVFATRSPNRPNPIGLSAVKIEKISTDNVLGPIIEVTGPDMADGTPIYDIKPYLPYADSLIDAGGGFTDSTEFESLEVVFDSDLKSLVSSEYCKKLIKVLECDPRPRYQHDSDRIYGLDFGGYNVKFSVKEKTLTVLSIKKLDK